MAILSPISEAFDVFVADMKASSREDAARSLERADGEIYLRIDRKRFRLIRKDGRTVLTTLGAVTFRRRYYFDEMLGSCVHPLDAVLGLPRYSRYSNELRVKALELAVDLTYEQTGRMLSGDFALSKSTVSSIVRDAKVEAAMPKPFRFGGRIHVQIDEKFVGVAGRSGKRRFMTATVFTGVEPVAWGRAKRNRLANRTVVSSYSVAGLAARLNAALRSLYGATPDTEIWLSGDLALYIRCFPERIDCCKATYVPDRWHVCKFLSDSVGRAVRPKEVRAVLDGLIAGGDLTGLQEDAMKVVRMYLRNRRIFDPWGDETYLGCSQEAQNSHVYAPRFGKYASRFRPETLEKLAAAKEARLNGWKLSFLSKGRKTVDKSSVASLGREYEERIRYDIDTTEMSYASRKLFDSIEYGGVI
jgi:hypothetical protein